MTRVDAAPRLGCILAVALVTVALGCSSTAGPDPGSSGGSAGGSTGSRGGNAGQATGGAPGTSGGAGRSGSGGAATGGAAGLGGSTGGTIGQAGAGGGRAGAGGGRAGAGGGRAGAGGGGGRAGAGGAAAGHGGGGQGGRPQVDGGSSDGPSLAGTNNPVLPGLNADPQIAVFDGIFYLYPTTDGFANWSGTTFSAFSSTNLVDWTSRGVILDLPRDVTWATAYAWAPAIARAGSSYYFYFCADKQIGVAVGTSPAGPFKDALGHPLIAIGAPGTSGTQVIDPYVFTDDDGTSYLYFGSASGGLRMVKLGADMKSLVGTPANISPSGAAGTLEASVMFKRNGTYYLQWSEGDTRLATYQVAYGRAKSPSGPFAREAVILSQNSAMGILGPGGSTVLAVPARDEYDMVYHRFKIPGGDGTHREVCIDRMTFNSDGTIAPVHPTLAGLQSAVTP